MVDYLRRLPPVVQDAVSARMRQLADRLSTRVKQKLSGEVLSPKTGRLRNSIVARFYESGKKATISLASRGDVPYAAIHEYGGRIGPHRIAVRSRSVLAWSGAGGLAFARYVRHPGAQIPERSYMRSSIDEVVPDMRAALEDAIREAFD